MSEPPPAEVTVVVDDEVGGVDTARWEALAAAAASVELHEERIVPRMDEWEVVPQVAVATAMTAQEQGLAALSKNAEELHRDASDVIRQARKATRVFMQHGLIAPADE